MFTGDLYLTDDKDIALQTSYDSKFRVLVLCDDLGFYFNPGEGGELYNLSVLLPPNAANELYANGNIDAYHEMYYNHLMSYEVQTYMGLIMAGMMKGMSFMLYIGKDEMELDFIPVFVKFVQDQYGIKIGVPRQYDCEFNIQYQDRDLIIMFTHGYVDAITLIQMLQNYVADADLAYKMCQELGIVTQDPINDVNRYMNQYRTMNFTSRNPIKSLPFGVRL